MKFKSLIKSTPFWSLLLIITFLCIANQKEYTKLRILIWNTPSLPLGSYLAISSGAGFCLSYLLSSKLAKVKQSKPKPSLKFKNDDTNNECNEYIGSNSNTFFENTLIERDIKDPSPTINANFRIIGKQNKKNEYFKVNNRNKINYSTQFNDDYEEPIENDETINQTKSFSADWSDESYSTW